MKGLGRGFDSLIPTDLIDDEFDLTAVEDKKESKLKELKLDDIVRDEEQPRREFDEGALEALAASIKEHGVLQPIVVTKEEGKYKIVAGERRWRASKIAGLTKIPAIIRTLDSQNRLELSIIENAQREDLNAIELATAYAKLKNQFNLTPEDIAAKVGKSESSIQNTLRLLNLPDDVKKTMVKEKLSEGVMRPLVSRDEATIKKVLPKIIDEGWTARKVERYFAETKKKSSSAAIKRSGYIKDENALATKYNTPVKISGHSLTFKCKTESDLKSLINLLKATCLILLGATLLSFTALKAVPTHADDTIVSDISLVVPVSCNVNAEGNTSHNAEVSAGLYQDDIGTTTFQVICNDNSGFAIYAVGYSNSEKGNTKLLATINNELNPTYDILTGTATSGSTSNWAMKLMPVAGTYAPTIENGFNAYSNVPADHTKVATFTSSTDFTIGSKLQSTYAVFVNNNQPAGTYAGKVKYTLVHPNTADAPTEPHDTNSGYIGYYPNASGVVDNMGDQAISDTATSAMLWPTNFKRPGYGFAGWSDAHDYKINEGSSSNPNAHIYGPMETISFTAGQYSGTNKGLSLYAVWVKSAGNLQGWTGCNSLQQGAVTALTDTRDNNTYAVAKLVDGKCWMVENLRLDYTANITPTSTQSANNAFGGVFSGLAEPETAHFGNSTTANSLYKSDGSGDIKGINGATLSDIGTSNDPGYRFPRYRNDNTNTNSTINPNTTVANQTKNSSNIYSYGNYYTWAAAIADTGYYTTRNQTVTTSSLCPTGWHLPSGGMAYASDDTGTVNVTGKPETYREFYNLGYKIMGSDKTAYEDTLNGGYSYYSNNITNTNGDTAMVAFRRFPNNFLYSGYITGSSVSGRGSDGRYWSSTANSNNYAYGLTMYRSLHVRPGTSYNDNFYGFAIRCLAGS